MLLEVRLFKLRDVGVGGIVSIIKAGFSCGRLQRVVVDDACSEEVRMVLSVPQDRVLVIIVY